MNVHNSRILDIDVHSQRISNGKMGPTVVDKVANKTNRVKLGYPMIVLPAHESPGGRTLPLQGIGVEATELNVQKELLLNVIDNKPLGIPTLCYH